MVETVNRLEKSRLYVAKKKASESQCSRQPCMWPKREHWKAEVTPLVDKSTIEYIWLEREHWKRNRARMAKTRALESPSEGSHRQEKKSNTNGYKENHEQKQ